MSQGKWTRIDDMTDIQFDEFLYEKRTCTGCQKTLMVMDFLPFTKARGKTTLRSWCNNCVRKYYREYASKKRQKKVETI